jgi:dTDP-4-amino-4,6-dideoxygalactose transaminase
MKTLSWDKYHGHLSSYDIRDLGYNYRTTEIQSALGLIQLKKLDRNNQKRKRLVKAYWKELQGAEGVSIPFPGYETGPSYHLFPVLISPSIPRDRVMDGLRGHGIQASIHYPPIHLFSLYRRQFGYKYGVLPKTEEVSRREVTLPLHPGMNEEDVRWIAKKFRRVIQNAKRGSV